MLYKYLSGFWTNFSTGFCPAQLTDFILRGMDKEFHTSIILVDLPECLARFTVLLQSIECIGFKESVIKWFQSYLSNRIFL